MKRFFLSKKVYRTILILSATLLLIGLIVLLQPRSVYSLMYLGEENRPEFQFCQIRTGRQTQINLTPEDTSALLTLLDDARIQFNGFYGNSLYADEGNSIYDLYFSDKEISFGDAFACQGLLIFQDGDMAFWDSPFRFRLMKENRNEIVALLQGLVSGANAS